MRVLVTNDDGVRAPGIAVLASALCERGHKVVVVAPMRDCSGAGAGVGPVHRHGGLSYEKARIEGLDVPAYAIDGLPAMAVIAACLGGFGSAPQMVLSGVNLGLNVGFSVLHSGTVGAALTATHFDIPAIAASVEVPAPGEKPHFETAAILALDVMDLMEKEGFGPRTSGKPSRKGALVVNVNAPNRALSDVVGVRRAGLAHSGTIRSAVDVPEEHRQSLEHAHRTGSGYLQLDLGQAAGAAGEGTDAKSIMEGWATLTALRPVWEESYPEVEEMVDAMASQLTCGIRERDIGP
jgi:5'-nucleotidase